MVVIDVAVPWHIFIHISKTFVKTNSRRVREISLFYQVRPPSIEDGQIYPFSWLLKCEGDRIEAMFGAKVPYWRHDVCYDQPQFAEPWQSWGLYFYDIFTIRVNSSCAGISTYVDVW